MDNSKDILVSIIVPVYNVENYLDDCLESIKVQTYKNIEIIAVEDCSTDNSKLILESHCSDKRIKIIQQNKNSGLSAARNKGIEVAKGDYLIFVDSDDVIHNNLVATCIKCLKDTNADMITYGIAPFQDGILQSEIYNSSSQTNATAIKQYEDFFELEYYACSKFIRTSILKSSKIRFPLGLHYEDWPFHWHIGLEINNKFYLQENMYFYRKRSTSITGSTGKELLDAFKVQLMVISIIEHYNSENLVKIFVRKVSTFNFYILNFIDNEFLYSALNLSRQVADKLSLYDYNMDRDYRTIFTFFMAKNSNVIALPASCISRVLLHRIILPPYRKLSKKIKKDKSKDNV